jgi:2-polyprenyl-3-methyl-5-hydroxy-6-metoxy-1,4-benzoquinol methylase
MVVAKDKSLQASAIFNKYAREYQDKFMSVSLYEDSLNLFCNLISKENAKILDLACGPGNITKYLLGQKSDLIIRGIDLAPNMVLLAQTNNPGASFEVMDCRSIANLSEIFDGLVCSFCLPYLSKEETNILISDVHKLLSEGAVFYLSTMEDDYEKSGYETGSKGEQIFMHFYKGQYLVDLLEKNNFDIVETVRKSSIMSNGKEVVDLIIISQKKNSV